jgi:hypothetical protein
MNLRGLCCTACEVQREAIIGEHGWTNMRGIKSDTDDHQSDMENFPVFLLQTAAYQL